MSEPRHPSTLDEELLEAETTAILSELTDAQRLLRIQDELRRKLPEDHRRFFSTLSLTHEEGDYLFVHAGVRPSVPLAAQSESDLVWIRAPFLDHAGPFGKVVVHGHTPTRTPVTRENRIGIDTGAVFTGQLTALRLLGISRTFLQIEGRPA